MIISFILILLAVILLYTVIGKLAILALFIGIIVFLVWLWLKKYRPILGYTMLVTGAPGTGKSKLTTDYALHRYRISLSKWKMTKKSKRGPMPVLCSNYPILVSGRGKNKKFSVMLKPEYVLLHEKLPKGSVYVIDEIGSLIGNHDYKNPYAKINVDEWIRFIRQYGYSIYANDQSSDNVEVHIRRRFNKLYNLQDYRRLWFLGIGITYIRHMSISEDIKVIETKHSEDMKVNTSWIPLFWWKKTYDSKAYSERIDTVPYAQTQRFDSFKTNYLPSVPVLQRGEIFKPPLTKNK